MGYITAIGTAVPQYSYTQEELRDFYLESTNDLTYKRKIKIVSDRSGIDKRHSVIGDFKKSPEDFEFFNKTPTLLPEPTLTERMTLYKREALPLAIKAVFGIKNFNTIK